MYQMHIYSVNLNKREAQINRFFEFVRLKKGNVGGFFVSIPRKTLPKIE